MPSKAADALSIFVCMRNAKLLALLAGETKREGFGLLQHRKLEMRYYRKLGPSQGNLLWEQLLRKKLPPG